MPWPPSTPWNQARTVIRSPSSRAWWTPPSTLTGSCREPGQRGRCRGTAQGNRQAAWPGSVCSGPTERQLHAGRRRVRAARGRGRGRDRRPSAPEAGALRRDPLRRPARRPLPRRRRGGRVRRDPHLRRSRLRHHRPPQRHPGPARGPPAGWRTTRSSCARARRRSCTRSWTAWSTATRRWSPGCRRTSTRSRPRSSAATRRCRRRIYELSREVIDFQRSTRPLLGMLGGLERASTSTAPTRSSSRRLRDVADHATHRRRAGRRLPPDALRHPDRQRHAREPGAERGDQARSP